MPLVGERTRVAPRSMVASAAGTEQTRAPAAIIDITGVPVV